MHILKVTLQHLVANAATSPLKTKYKVPTTNANSCKGMQGNALSSTVTLKF